MRSARTEWFRVAAAAFFCAVFGGVAWGIEPITILGNKADVIVVARLESLTGDSTATVWAVLQPITVLKGQLPDSPITAALAPSPLMQQHAGAYADGRQLRTYLGPVGLWFLKQGPGGSYQVIPVTPGNYTGSDAYFPMLAQWLPPAKAATLNQKLLYAIVSSYESLPPSFTALDEEMVFYSLDFADRRDAMPIAEELMASLLTDQRVIGYAAAIHLGSDEALVRLSEEIEALQTHKKFSCIMRALYTYYKPNGNPSIAPLRKLIESHADVPGLEAAVAKALQKVGTKEVLPTMAMLLDSRNPSVVSAAAWYFHFYTAMAGRDGNVETGGTGSGTHPFWSPDTMRYASTRNGTITQAELVSFWKSWWAQNRAKIGFPESPTGQKSQ